MIRDKEKILLTKRLQYKEVDDSGYKGPLIFITGAMVSCLILILGLEFLAGFIFIAAMSASIAYYVYRPRHCEVCKEKMLKFYHEDFTYYCCDKDQIIFKLLIGSGD